MSTISREEQIGPDVVRVFDRFFDNREDLDMLVCAILALRAKSPQSVASHSIGGWKSEIRVLGELARTTRAAERLASAIASAVDRPVVSSWAMINERGARHPWHVHKLAKLTGVMFLCADSDASPLELGDPGDDLRSGPPRFLGEPGQRISIPAIAGRLVLFPARIWHHVPEVTGEGVRISIAFDVL